jgi:hypothetical protein
VGLPWRGRHEPQFWQADVPEGNGKLLSDRPESTDQGYPMRVEIDDERHVKGNDSIDPQDASGQIGAKGAQAKNNR